jgi:hypothetical protein
MTRFNQVFFSQARNYLSTLKPEIMRASAAYGIPPEIVATTLIAELLDYNAQDYFFDDTVLWGAEAHSLGVAQIRIDTARKWQLNNWNTATPAHEIRSALNNPPMAVTLLAELLSKINNADRRRVSFIDWNQREETSRKNDTMLFLGAKDDDVLSGDGQLCGLIDVAWQMVQDSNLFALQNFSN